MLRCKVKVIVLNEDGKTKVMTSCIFTLCLEVQYFQTKEHSYCVFVYKQTQSLDGFEFSWFLKENVNDKHCMIGANKVTNFRWAKALKMLREALCRVT